MTSSSNHTKAIISVGALLVFYKGELIITLSGSLYVCGHMCACLKVMFVCVLQDQIAAEKRGSVIRLELAGRPRLTVGLTTCYY